VNLMGRTSGEITEHSLAMAIMRALNAIARSAD